MKELVDIVRAFHEITARDEQAVLATVVSVIGSAYRKPGARMLVTQQGIAAGSVSAGCLEADVVEHTLTVLTTGEPMLLTYDTRDDDPVFGVGGGCRGVIKILVERLDSQSAQALLLPLSRTVARIPAVLATIYAADRDDLVGERTLFPSFAGHLDVASEMAEAAWQALLTQRTLDREIRYKGNRVRVCFEYLQPPVSLIICGAGPDSLPLAHLATSLGWQVTVIDHRPAYAVGARYPEANQVILGRPSEIADDLVVDKRTAIVIMSHNYEIDRDFLAAFVGTSAGYIGLLGSQNRSGQLLNELHDQHIDIPPTLHAPTGLDIGAETPEQIALAIVAEIQSVFAGQPGGSLSARTNPRERTACPASA